MISQIIWVTRGFGGGVLKSGCAIDAVSAGEKVFTVGLTLVPLSSFVFIYKHFLTSVFLFVAKNVRVF